MAVQDESDEDQLNSDVQLDLSETASVLKNAIGLLDLHEIGSKLGDAHIMKLAREGCAHLQKKLPH